MADVAAPPISRSYSLRLGRGWSGACSMMGQGSQNLKDLWFSRTSGSQGSQDLRTGQGVPRMSAGVHAIVPVALNDEQVLQKVHQLNQQDNRYEPRRASLEQGHVGKEWPACEWRLSDVMLSICCSRGLCTTQNLSTVNLSCCLMSVQQAQVLVGCLSGGTKQGAWAYKNCSFSAGRPLPLGRKSV